MKFFRPFSLLVVLLAWGGVSALSWFVSRARRGTAPLVSLPVWGATDSAALLLTLLLVPTLVGPPLANVGATDSEGNRLYRAYFTADHVWAAAVVSGFSAPAMQ